MKIKCTNKKEFKNLTLDKEYEVVNEDDNFYYINNNAELESRYSKELFTVIPETIDFNIDNVRITVSGGQDVRRTVNILYNNNPLINFIIEHLTIGTTNISCGIYQVYGINGSCERIINQRGALQTNLTRLNITNVQEADILNILTNLVFKEYVKTVVAACAVRFVLLSTNVTDNGFFTNEQYSFGQVLDELSSTVEEGRNPNSGNQIKLWIIKKE